MKKFINKHKDVLTVLFILFVYRIYFLFIVMNQSRISVRSGYLGFLRDANFDGVYYLYIAQFGYHGYDQAFFPLFPLAIQSLIFTGFNPISAALITVITSLFAFLYVFSKLIKIDYPGVAYIWILLFSLAFPSSFFLSTVYTESLFLFLTITSFYLARKKKIFLASLFGALASATRLVGIFLLPALILEVWEQHRKKKFSLKPFLPLFILPMGLLSYMGYLWVRYSDPLLFVHLQPLFGAGRSGGEVILLPQVLYRYIKIFMTLSINNLTFWISVGEFLTLCTGAFILVLAYKKKIRKSYILFSILVLLFPTLSGTLSSLPRYALASFVIFIFLGLLKSRLLKIILIVLGLVIEGIFAILFLQGYFVS